MRAYYLAYGSNLHPYRLTERVPSAKFVDVVELACKRLLFHKRSDDGSGKCMFYDTRNDMDLVYCALFDFDSAEQAKLDRAEGAGFGYQAQQMKVTLNGHMYVALIYVAQSTHIDGSLRPYAWYKEMVRLGAAYHSLPPAYIAAIAAVPAVADPDLVRAANRQIVVDRMRTASLNSGRST